MSDASDVAAANFAGFAGGGGGGAAAGGYSGSNETANSNENSITQEIGRITFGDSSGAVTGNNNVLIAAGILSVGVLLAAILFRGNKKR